jgi:hypothetical protein
MKKLEQSFTLAQDWQIISGEDRSNGPIQEGVPFRNKFCFRQQIQLTPRKSLYNGQRVGEYKI